MSHFGIMRTVDGTMQKQLSVLYINLFQPTNNYAIILEPYKAHKSQFLKSSKTKFMQNLQKKIIKNSTIYDELCKRYGYIVKYFIVLYLGKLPKRTLL